ncbi:MAG: Gfo/Idh/MocA family oxidoreductase [Clostridia bacterium]|nr:Gfo/Idh/MocA family oxidoreductase [Clostridia bacterium]
MKHFLIAGKGYIGGVHADTAPIAAEFLVRRKPESADDGIYTDFAKAVENKPLFLDICTPNDSHKALALQAAAQNLPIYCEKPLAASLTEAEEMAAVATQKGLYTGMAFNYRFLPCVHLLKQALAEGKIGKVIYYKGAFLHDSYVLPRPKAWRMTAAAGGGALADLGIHLFDLCRFIFGESEVVACEQHTEFPERTEVDEYARCTLQSDAGKGYLEISRISAGRSGENGLEVFGRKGSLRIVFDRPYQLEFYDIERKTTTVYTAGKELLDLLHYPDGKHDMGMFYGSHKAAITTFINGLEQGVPSPVLATFADGVAAQQMLHDALTLSK